MARAKTDQIVVNGMVWGKVAPLMTPIDYEEFQRTIIDALGVSKEQFRPDVESVQTSMFSQGFTEFREPHLDDPRDVKWILLLPPKTPQTEKIAEALKRLVEHREGQIVHVPTAWEDWLNDYKYTPQEDRPYYVLIAGTPAELPFRFQYLLDVDAAFLYPWALVFKGLGAFGLVEMAAFVGVLLVGYFYVWRKGGFKWE